MRRTAKKVSKQDVISKRTKAGSLKTAEKQCTAKTSPKKGTGKGPAKSTSPVKKNMISGIKKQYLKSNGSCNVTFKLPKEAAPDAQMVTIVGDFNDWNLSENKMKKMRNGDFKVTLKLHRDTEYRFRYFIDNARWENDWCADRYVPNTYGCDDSLVIV